MRDYPHVLSELIHTPLMAHPAKALIVASVVLQRSGRAVDMSAAELTMGPAQERRMREQRESLRRRYGVEFKEGEKDFLFDARSGAAIIEVTGSLAHRQWEIGESSGVIGYDGIGAQLDAAAADPEVRWIALDGHTPGGHVHGAFGLADRIASCAKPTVAIVDEMMLSAGYLLAAACNEIILASEMSDVGSVGTLAVHISWQQYLKNEGIKPSLIHAGAHKTDANPFEDLSPEVLARIQSRVDAANDMLVGRVAKWRGMTEQAVRDMQAAVFTGRDAVNVGLADGIAPPQAVLAALAVRS